MILNFHKRELRIEIKEREIEKVAKQFHQRIDQDRTMVKKINEKLANGITLKVARAAGHK